jgi:hypothetical protein
LPTLPIVQDFWDVLYIYYYRSVKNNLYFSFRHAGSNTASIKLSNCRGYVPENIPVGKTKILWETGGYWELKSFSALMNV